MTRMRPSLIGAPVNGPRDVAGLVEAGADVMYCGLQLARLREALGTWALENGRDSAEASIASVATLRELAGEVRGYGRELMLAMNRVYPASVRSHVEAAIGEAADAGVDGFILADVALAAFLRTRWPHLKLVASTFLGVHNRPGLQLAGRLGFDRVVLPRAMRIDEIRELANGKGPEIEVFVARERCRFVNAYCRLEHALPAPDGSGRLQFPCRPLCATPLVDDSGKARQVEYESASLESCGLCAAERLNGRVRVFKVVGRGMSPGVQARYVRAVRRVLDGGVPGPHPAKRVAREAGIPCSIEACYYPDVEPVRGGPLRKGRHPAPPTFPRRPEASGDAPEVLVALPAERDLPTALPAGASGAWLGDETCVHLLPSPARLRTLLSRVLSLGLRPALVLPPLFGSAAAARGLRLVETLARSGGQGPRITVNDIGTLIAVHGLLGPDAELSMGRVMVAQRTDPRLRRGTAGENGVRTFDSLPWEHLDALAALVGTRRIEMSAPSAWPAFGGTYIGRATLHVGPALNAVSRACHTLADLHAEVHGARPFLVPARCGRPCIGRAVSLRPADGPEVFRSRGNALYSLATCPEPVPTWVDRVILHPDP